MIYILNSKILSVTFLLFKEEERKEEVAKHIFDYSNPGYPSPPYPMTQDYLATKSQFKIVRILAVNMAYFMKQAQHTFSLLIL